MNAVEANHDGTGYYALHVRYRGEVTIADALRRRGHTVLLPNAKRIPRNQSRLYGNLFAPLFPGYLFVEASLRNLTQLSVIKGVNSVVKTGSALHPLPEQEIASIRLLCDEPGECKACQFLSVGQHIRVDSGLFAGMEGILIRAPDRYRIIISFHSLSSSVAVDLRDTQISIL